MTSASGKQNIEAMREGIDNIQYYQGDKEHRPHVKEIPKQVITEPRIKEDNIVIKAFRLLYGIFSADAQEMAYKQYRAERLAEWDGACKTAWRIPLTVMDERLHIGCRVNGELLPFRLDLNQRQSYITDNGLSMSRPNNKIDTIQLEPLKNVRNYMNKNRPYYIPERQDMAIRASTACDGLAFGVIGFDMFEGLMREHLPIAKWEQALGSHNLLIFEV